MGLPTESEKVLEHKELQKIPIDNPNIELDKAPLNEAIAQIIDKDLSTEQKTEQISQIIEISRESFSGPIPHPKIMEGYQKIIQSAPERILAMAEKEQQHRIDVDNEMLAQNRENIRNSNTANKRSQDRATLLIILLIVAGFTLSVFNYSITVGSIIFGSTILGVAGVFITGKLTQKNSDTTEKNK